MAGRFVFRFEAVLRLQENERDACRAHVAEAQRALDIVDGQIEMVDRSRGDLRGELQGALVGRVSVEQLLSRGRYDLQLDAERRGLISQRQQILVELQRRQLRLTMAEQECRKLERLREVGAERHQSEQLKRQQAVLDEMATLRAARSLSLGAKNLSQEFDR